MYQLPPWSIRAVKLGLLLAASGVAAQASSTGLRYLAGADGGGMSAAVVVDPQPLAHTAQVFATGPRGEPPSGAPDAQVRRTLENLEAALRSVGAGLDRIVRIHVYVTDPAVVPVVEQVFRQRLQSGARPAVTFMAGKLPVAGAVVAMDAVAGVAPAATRPRPAAPAGGAPLAAVLPAGPVLFISGRAEPGDPVKAARDTIARLGRDLELLGLGKRDVVQVKSFVSPITATEEVRQEILAFFAGDPIPPLVFVEWHNRGRPVEIELVAAAAAAAGRQPDTAVDYITPPGENANPLFTRLVRVNRGRLVYTAGLFGRTDRSAEPEIREIFAELRSILQKAGSDFEHMAKATYHVTDEPSSTLLNTIRRELYNPKRPPAASKVSVTGTGRAAKTITLDMIAVAP
jgi:enamine deaminase RidA (YjgF/YER057c/UK114 family)